MRRHPRHATCSHDADAPARGHDGDDRPATTRRRVVAGASALGVAALAGCLTAGSGETPDPIALSGSKQCDVCGMTIAENPGPNGQIFYRDESPDGRDNPAWFDTVRNCTFPYHFDKRALDWNAVAIYVTDYSTVDYGLLTEGDTTYISGHTAPESFADATDLSYVDGSDVVGAMGPDLFPFSETADAEAFADEHGGEVVAFEDITPAMVRS